MVTGWKRWRPAVSFLAFFLGLTLLLSGGLRLTAGLTAWNGIRSLRDSFAENYQDSQRFKDYIFDTLEDFLTIAGGGALRQYENAYFPNAPEDADLTEKVLSLYEEDQNLLYWIRCINGEIFTNFMEYPIGQGDQPLPEGYNFLLTYDYGGITVFQNGRFCDWTSFQGRGLPNAAAGKIDLENPKEYCEPRVVLAAAAQPLFNTLAESGERYTLYGIVEELREIRRGYIQYAVVLLAGVVLLALAFIWRKWKRLADRRLARFMGHAWLELKAAAVAALLLFLSFPGGVLRDVIRIGREEGFVDLSSLLTVLRTLAFDDLFVFLLLFWVLYLVANDLRYHRGRFRSLWPLLRERAEAAQKGYPFQRRMILRQRGLLACAGVLTIFAAAPLASELSWGISVEFLGLCVIALTLALLLWLLRRNAVLVRDMGRMINQIEAIRDGNFAPLELDGDLADAALALNGVEEGLSAALEERIKSERMKVELITNVSHDIKTPLTSIIGYVELLKQEELPEAARDYVRILDEKSRRLRTMVQDVFEVSKAASGQLPVKRETLDFGKLLRQTLADMAEAVEQAPVTVRTDIPDGPVPVEADGQRMYRVFQNLIQNALQYSLDGSRVYVTLRPDGKNVAAAVKNTSKTELAEMDYTERFVRGDASRADGGSGLGLSIARSFTEACGGSFRVETDADLFTASVSFPLAEQPPADAPGNQGEEAE